MATCAIVPIVLLPLSWMVAATLTAVAARPAAGLVRLNVIPIALLFAGPPEAAVSMSVPPPSQLPALPNFPEVEAKDKEPDVPVCDPASPVMVTKDPSERS